MLLLSFVNSMNEKRRSSRDANNAPQTQIIAPKPFLDCLYKECTMTYKGVVETRTAGKTTLGGSNRMQENGAKTSEYFNLKFNGIIFPMPIKRICNFSKAILQHPKNEKVLS